MSMQKLKGKQRMGNIVRSSMSGKIMNGKDAIMTDEAKTYLKKQGYVFDENGTAIDIEKAIELLKRQGMRVIPEKIVAGVIVFTTLFLVFGALILLKTYLGW